MVVRLEVAVVQRLRVVRIGARIEEQPRQRLASRVRQLVPVVLASAEGAGERGERIRALPEEAGVGIGAALEQHTYDVERRTMRSDIVQSRVAGVEQRLPRKWTAPRVDQRGIAVDGGEHCGHVSRGGGSVNRRAGQMRMLP